MDFTVVHGDVYLHVAATELAHGDPSSPGDANALSAWSAVIEAANRSAY